MYIWQDLTGWEKWTEQQTSTLRTLYGLTSMGDEGTFCLLEWDPWCFCIIGFILSLVLLRRCINGTGLLTFPSLKNKQTLQLPNLVTKPKTDPIFLNQSTCTHSRKEHLHITWRTAYSLSVIYNTEWPFTSIEAFLIQKHSCPCKALCSITKSPFFFSFFNYCFKAWYCPHKSRLWLVLEAEEQGKTCS